MKSLWAPWRMTYIREEKEEGCIFCSALSDKRDEQNLILYRAKDVFAIMNRFPYNNGHVMIVPNRHRIGLESLKDDEFRELFAVVKDAVNALKESLSPDGFNLGMNLGKEAGAGKDHLHIHIVPRWAGDTNFMPVLADTRVMVEYLNETYHKLLASFQNVLGKQRRESGGLHE